MRKEKSKTINNINFTVTQLGFDDGIELLTTLGHILGPVLGKANAGVEGLGQLIARIDAAQLKSIIQKLAKTTRIEREPNKWPILEPEVDLSGNYELTFKWLGFALEANYGDFLGEGGLLSGIIGSVNQQA
jgi:hypothetical protein